MEEVLEMGPRCDTPQLLCPSLLLLIGSQSWPVLAVRTPLNHCKPFTGTNSLLSDLMSCLSSSFSFHHSSSWYMKLMTSSVAM